MMYVYMFEFIIGVFKILVFIILKTVMYIFSEVGFTDAGNYTCIATNNYGTANASGTLTVKGTLLNNIFIQLYKINTINI